MCLDLEHETRGVIRELRQRVCDRRWAAAPYERLIVLAGPFEGLQLESPQDTDALKVLEDISHEQLEPSLRPNLSSVDRGADPLRVA